MGTRPRSSIVLPPYGSGTTGIYRAMHILLRMLIPHGGEPPCHLQIDKLPDGRYRATAGPLPEAHELCRTPDLEALFRQADRLSACRSFREVLTALQQLSELDDGRATPQPKPRGAVAGPIGRRFWPVKRRPAGYLVWWR